MDCSLARDGSFWLRRWPVWSHLERLCINLAFDTVRKSPIWSRTASVVRCAASKLRADDRICRSTASMGLAALVKLRIEWIPGKTLCN
jgi:hypothetical protein